MEITVMEKVYRGLKCVLYINGFPVVTNNNSILDETSNILSQLGYTITKKRFISAANDEIPTNEVPFNDKLLAGVTLNVVFSRWVEYKDGDISDYGYNLKSELFNVNAVVPVKEEIIKLLTKLGADVTVRDGSAMNYNPSKREEKNRVMFIVYENSNFNQWNDNEGFSTVAEVREKLKKEGFFQTTKGWEKNAIGWSGPMRAYIGYLNVK